MSDMSKYIKKSDIKCPICQTLLDVAIMSDKVFGCPKCRNMGNIDLWQKLDRTRKALDVAKEGLKEIQDKGEYVNPIELAESYLDEITALEQKD